MQEYKMIFIGGVPGVGKTSLSGILSKKLGIDLVLSGDYRREFISPLLKDQESIKLLSTSVYDSWKAFGDKNRDNIIKGFEGQSKIICEGLAAAFSRAHKNGESLIIESLYVNKDLLSLMKSLGVNASYLYISDQGIHAKRLNERGLYTHFKSPGDRLVAQLDVYREIMGYSVELFKNAGFPIFDNMSFADTSDSLYKHYASIYSIGKETD